MSLRSLDERENLSVLATRLGKIELERGQTRRLNPSAILILEQAINKIIYKNHYCI